MGSESDIKVMENW